MKRRTFLTTATAALGIGVTAGCLADGDTPGTSGSTGTETTEQTDTPQSDSTKTTDPAETDEPSETPKSTPQSSLTSEFEATGDCSSPNSASVAFESASVVVTGCIQGPNGCHQPALRSATVNEDTLEVVVTTEKQGGDMCTEALVQRGYEATVEFDGDLPATVTVVHESMGERTTATTADR